MGDSGLAQTHGARMKARLCDLDQLVPAFVAARLRGKKHLDAHEWFAGIGAKRTYDNGHTVEADDGPRAGDVGLL